MTRAIKSELVKLRTTNTWWLMGIGIVLFVALGLAFNMANAHFASFSDHSQLIKDNYPKEEQAKALAEEHERYAQAHTAAAIAKVAASLYTSGQFFGVMLIMVMSAMLVTNEFFRQTATSTFLAVPHRTQVIFAKFVAGIAYSVGAWVIATAVSIPAGAVFLSTEHVSNSLTRWDTIQSVLLNLAAYTVWAVIGSGLGVLLRSQIATIVTGIVAYLIGSFAASVVFELVHAYLIKADWVLTAQVIIPSTASTIMITPGEAFEHAPPQWVGAAVLIGYGVIAGVIGTLITRKRDIS